MSQTNAEAANNAKERLELLKKNKQPAFAPASSFSSSLSSSMNSMGDKGLPPMTPKKSNLQQQVFTLFSAIKGSPGQGQVAGSPFLKFGDQESSEVVEAKERLKEQARRYPEDLQVWKDYAMACQKWGEKTQKDLKNAQQRISDALDGALSGEEKLLDELTTVELDLQRCNEELLEKGNENSVLTEDLARERQANRSNEAKIRDLQLEIQKRDEDLKAQRAAFEQEGTRLKDSEKGAAGQAVAFQRTITRLEAEKQTLRAITKKLRQELSSVKGGLTHLKETARKEITHLHQETQREVRSQHLMVSGILRAKSESESVLRSEVERLQADLSASQKSATTETKQILLALSEARKESDESKTNVDILEAEIQDLVEQNHDLLREKESLQSKLGAAERSAEQLAEQLASREALVSSLTGGKGAQEQQLEGERAARKKLEQTLKGVQAQLDQAADAINNLEEERKSLTESSDHQSSEIEQLKGRCALKEAEAQKLKKDLDQQILLKEQALSQVKEGATTMQTLQGENQQQYITIRKTLDEKKDLQDQCSKVRLEQQTLSRKYEALKASEADLQKELDQEKHAKEELIKAHSEEIGNLQTTQLELQHQLGVLEHQKAKEIAALRAEVQSRDNTIKLSTQQTVEYKHKNNEVERYKKELEKIEEELKAAVSEANQHIATANRLKLEAVTTKAKTDAAEANLRETLKRYQGEKEMEMEKLQKKVQNAEKEAEQRVSSEMATLHESNEKMRHNFNESQLSVKLLEEKNRVAEHKLSLSADESRKKDIEIQRLRFLQHELYRVTSLKEAPVPTTPGRRTSSSSLDLTSLNYNIGDGNIIHIEEHKKLLIQLKNTEAALLALEEKARFSPLTKEKKIDVEELQKQLTQAKEHCKRLEKEIESHKRAISRIQTDSDQQAEFHQREVQQLKNQIQDLLQVKDTFSARVSKTTSLTDVQLGMEAQRLKHELTVKESSLAKLREKVAELSGIEAQCNQLKELLEEEMECSHQKDAEIRNGAQMIECLKQEIQELTLEKDQMAFESRSLQTARDTLVSQSAQNANSITEYQNYFNATQKELFEERTRLLEQKQITQEASHEVSRLKKELKMAKDQKDEVVAKWQASSAALERAQALATQTSAEVSRVALLETNISSLQARLAQAQQEAAHQANALQHAHEELRKAQAHAHQSRQTQTLEMQEAIFSQTQAESLTKERDQYFARACSLQSEKDELEKKIFVIEKVTVNRLQQEIQDLNQKAHDLQATLDDANKSLRDSGILISKLKSDLILSQQRDDWQAEGVNGPNIEKMTAIITRLGKENKELIERVRQLEQVSASKEWMTQTQTQGAGFTSQSRESFREILSKFSSGLIDSVVPEAIRLNAEEILDELETSEVGHLRGALDSLTQIDIQAVDDKGSDGRAIRLMHQHVTELRKLWKHEVVSNIFLRKAILDLRNAPPVKLPLAQDPAAWADGTKQTKALEAEIKELVHKLGSSELQLNQALSEAKKAQQMSEIAQSSLEIMEKTLQLTEQEKHILEEVAEKSRLKKEELEMQIEEEEAKNSSLLTRVRAIEEQKRRIEGELARFQDQYSTKAFSQEGLLQDLQNQVRLLEDRNGFLTNQLAGTEREVSQLKASLQDFKHATQRILTLEEEKRTIWAHKADADFKISALEDESARRETELKVEVEALQRAAKSSAQYFEVARQKLQALQQENEALSKELRSQAHEREKALEQAEEISRLERRCAALQEKLTSLTAEKGRSELETSELVRQLQSELYLDQESFSDDLDKSFRNPVAEERVRQLEDTLAVQVRKFQALAEEKERLLDSMQDLVREKDSLTKLNAQLLQAQKELNLRRENSLKEVREVSSEKEAILMRFEELRGENKNLQEAFETLKKHQHLAHQTTVAGLEREVTFLKNMKTELESRITKLTTQRDEAQQEVQRVRSQFDSASLILKDQNRRDVLERELKLSEDKNAKLREQVAWLEAQLAWGEKKIEELTQRLVAKENIVPVTELERVNLKKYPKEISYLRQKLLRETSFRADLVYQKNYLLELLNTSEDRTVLARSFLVRSPPGHGFAYRSPTKESPLVRFKRAIVAVLAIERMKILQKSWKISRALRKEGSTVGAKPIALKVPLTPFLNSDEGSSKKKILEKVLEDTQAEINKLKLDSSAFLNLASQKIEGLKRK